VNAAFIQCASLYFTYLRSQQTRCMLKLRCDRRLAWLLPVQSHSYAQYELEKRVTLEPTPVPSWWVNGIVLPTIFLFLGATIGFAATWVRDQLDARNAKKAFMKAIRHELEALDQQLSSTIAEVEEASRKLDESQHLPQFGIAFRTAVYSTQLGKLKNLDDPILLEIVAVYSHISSLDEIVAAVNQQTMYVQPLKPAITLERSTIEEIRVTFLYSEGLNRVGSTCRVLIERLRALQPAVHTLLGKLPK
jgi:hypothetical protein